jgi:metallo-beta-lactamase family protein
VQVHAVDFYITESTYGKRQHDDFATMNNKVAEVVNRTHARGGKIIIPAFSVGRTQEIVYCLNQLWQEKKIPEIPVFVDSPLSTNATEVFRMHPECFDLETTDFLHEHEDPFGFARLKYIRDVDGSRKLNSYDAPCIIISASGMCEAGRILHHLKNNVEDPENTILIIGFMAENTLGRRLVERHEQVKIFGEPYALKAEVVIQNAFSAHADRDELLEYLGGINVKELKQVFVVHGEEDQSLALANNIRDIVTCEVTVPQEGDTVEL